MRKKRILTMYGILLLIIAILVCLIFILTNKFEIEKGMLKREISFVSSKNNELQNKLNSQQNNISSVQKITNSNKYTITSDELLLISKVVFLEAGDDTYENQVGVARTILNRVSLKEWKAGSIKEVIYSKGQFDVTPNIPNAKPTENCYKAVIDAVNNTLHMPYTIDSFKTNSYHYKSTAWKQLGGHFFSSLVDYKKQLGW